MKLEDLLQECDRLRLEAHAAFDGVRRTRAPYGLGERATRIPLSMSDELIAYVERSGDHAQVEAVRETATARNAMLDSLPSDVRAAVLRWHELILLLSETQSNAAVSLYNAGHNVNDIADRLGMEEDIVACVIADSLKTN